MQALQEFNMSASAKFSNLGSNIETAFAQADNNALESLKPILSSINQEFKEGRFQPFFDGITSVVKAGIWIFNTIQFIGVH